MNYDEIKLKYPQGYEAMLNWYSDRTGYRSHPKYFRDLYDFFDEIGIHVEVAVEDSKGEIPKQYEAYIRHYTDNDYRVFRVRLGFPSRREAEEAAFLASFEFHSL